MNPLKNQTNQMQNNSFNSFLNFINNTSNPEKFMNEFFKSNPKAKQMIGLLQNKFKGRNPRDIAFELAKENNIDLNQLTNAAKVLGQIK